MLWAGTHAQFFFAKILLSGGERLRNGLVTKRETALACQSVAAGLGVGADIKLLVESPRVGALGVAPRASVGKLLRMRACLHE